MKPAIYCVKRGEYGHYGERGGTPENGNGE